MRNFVIAMAAAMTFAAPAAAQTVLIDNFDGENGGATQLNYNGFANFTVDQNIGSTGGNPTVDLLRQPNGFGLTCAGGAGSCVDLDGSTNDGGRLTTLNSFSFLAGRIITLSVDVSGSQRGTTENIGLGFVTFGGPVQYLNLTANFPGIGTGGPTNGTGSLFGFQSSSLVSNAPYQTFTTRFTAGSAGTIRAFVTTNSNDNVGPLIDNFRLSIAGVPEPATWAMMILGFGFIGWTMRRRPVEKGLSFA